MRARAGVAAGWLVVLMLLAAASAQAERAFAPRFTANAQGDVAIAANTALSCITVDVSCAAIRDGTAPGNTLNNNTTLMSYVDVDSDPATFDSSAATLTLPTTAHVLFAGLYWGARTKAGIGGAAAPDASARGRVLLRAPGSDTYNSVTASQVDEAGDIYQGFADVTGAVRDAGGGEYTVADLQAGTGRNDAQLAGWSLVVAYGDQAAPPRSLAVFDGLQNVSTTLTAPVTIALSGFRTPTTGTVRSRAGIVAYEGDRNTTGDAVTLQSPAGDVGLPQGAPSNNAFRSAITIDGADDRLRDPAYDNQLGFDVHQLDTTNLLGNGQTSTAVKLSTRGDAYQPGVVTIATDLHAPRITATKTVDRSAAGLGDVLTYTTTIRNSGEDAATGVVFADDLPAGVTLVPGSVTVDGTAVPGADPAALALGTLAPGATRVVGLSVRVATGGLTTGTVIDNAADVAFTAEDLGTRDRVTTAPARTAIAVPDLAIGKSHSPALVSGGTSTYTLDVTNAGDAASSGTVRVTDTLDAALTATGPATGAGWTCTGTRAIACTRADALAPGADYPPIRIPVRVAAGAPAGEISNAATVSAAPDGDASDDTAIDAGAVSTPDVDLALTKTTSSAPATTADRYVPGEDVVFTLVVTNHGPDTAPEATVVDHLPAALLGGSGVSPRGPCDTPDAQTVRCDAGPLAAGESVTVTVRGTLATTIPPYPPGQTVTNTATVSAGSATDTDPSNDKASSTFDTVPVTDLSITKSFTPAHPAAGGLVTYTVTVRNNGPQVTDVAVADLIPDALQDVRAEAGGGATGDCQVGPFPGAPRDLPQCAIPQLEVGGERVFRITGRLAAGSAGTPVTNTAAVAGQAAEEDFSNNLAAVTFTPGTSALVLSKSVDTPTAAVGDTITYTLTARDTGDADTQGVVVTDPLPAGLAVAGGLPDGCAADAGTVTCRAAAIAAGAERAFAIPVTVTTAAAGTTVVNRATATSDDSADAPEAEADVAVAPCGDACAAAPPPAEAPAAPAPGETPAVPASPPSVGGQGSPPLTVAASCTSKRRFVIRLRERRGRTIVRASVTVQGRRIAVRRRADGRWVATVDLRGAPRATYRFTVRATLRGGRALRWSRAYRTCAAKQQASNRLGDPGAL